MSGWIKTHRSMLKWEWFTDYKTAHLFNYLLLKASHNDYKFRGVSLKAGQFPFGYAKASVECGLSIKMIRTALCKLLETNEVAKESSRQGTIITIVNWEKYQVGANDGAAEGHLQGQDRGKTGASTKKVNNIKKKRSSGFSDDLISLFVDHELITWLKETGSKKIHDDLYSKYNASFLKEEIYNAYLWQLEKDKRNAGLFVKSWCERSQKPDKSKDGGIKVIETELQNKYKHLLE